VVSLSTLRRFSRSFHIAPVSNHASSVGQFLARSPRHAKGQKNFDNLDELCFPQFMAAIEAEITNLRKASSMTRKLWSLTLGNEANSPRWVGLMLLFHLSFSSAINPSFGLNWSSARVAEPSSLICPPIMVNFQSVRY
jgi:hypothetical protein